MKYQIYISEDTRRQYFNTAMFLTSLGTGLGVFLLYRLTNIFVPYLEYLQVLLPAVLVALLVLAKRTYFTCEIDKMSVHGFFNLTKVNFTISDIEKVWSVPAGTQKDIHIKLKNDNRVISFKPKDEHALNDIYQYFQSIGIRILDVLDQTK